jgi:hypothetical protein
MLLHLFLRLPAQKLTVDEQVEKFVDLWHGTQVNSYITAILITKINKKLQKRFTEIHGMLAQGSYLVSNRKN